MFYRPIIDYLSQLKMIVLGIFLHYIWNSVFGLDPSSFQSTLGFKDTPASYPPSPHPHTLQSAVALTLLSSGSFVEDLDGPPDVQVEQSHGGCPLPLPLLLQRSQEYVHVDVGTSADPAAQPQGKAALLAEVPRHISLPV